MTATNASTIRIQIKATGLLADYLPATANAGTAEMEVPDGATPGDVIERLGMPGDARYLVILNGHTVSRDERGTRVLQSGDRLVLSPPLVGG